ncbi:MAG TPA: DUF559 domain-containing protein, partial [Acidimicrobiales bacterium]
GVTREALRHRIGRGRWVWAARRVVRIAGVPETWESRLLAHVLSAGEGAVASHRAAAELWGLDGVGRGIIELTVPRPRWYRVPGVRCHRSTDLDRAPATVVRGIPVTPVSRTLLDLGGVTGHRKVLLAVDSARRRRLTTWDDLLHTLVAHARRGRDGVGTLRQILDDHYGEAAVSDSAFERLVLSVLASAGLPTPELQHPVEADGQVYRLDLAYPAARLAIELDGSIHLERRVWEADHARQNALVLAGWTVLRFTWRDYVDRRHHLVAEVRAALEITNLGERRG